MPSYWINSFARFSTDFFSHPHRTLEQIGKNSIIPLEDVDVLWRDNNSDSKGIAVV